MIFLLITLIGHAQQAAKVEAKIEAIYLEPQIGLNRIESLLTSPLYFNGYSVSGEVSPSFELGIILKFRSNLTFQTGLRYLQHNTKTDSLNIPPISREDIWSEFTFEYSSLNIPLELGYDIGMFNNSIGLRPHLGILLRFLGGQKYSETVFQPNNPLGPGTKDIAPAELYDFEKFGVGMEGGLSLIFLPAKKISPKISGTYYQSSTNFRLIRGYNSNLADAMQGGTLKEKGLLFSGGVSFKL
jgi:long-subunit fatty acid transport protein